MANTNPIKTTDPKRYSDYIIPKKFSGKKITLSTTTSLAEEGWKLHLIHILSLDGDPVDFDPTPDIDKVMLGTGKNLVGLKLALVSMASRIRNGAAGNPSVVNYKIRFEADNGLFEEFTIASDETNPALFYTKITFKLEP